MRGFLSPIATGMIGLCLLAVACGSGPGTDRAAAADRRLRIVLGSEPRSFHPFIDNSRASVGIGRLVVEALVAPDSRTYQATKDGLTVDWRRVDTLTWEFDVRTGVRFHNGEVFDAEVAAFNILRARDEVTGVSSRYFAALESIETIDEDTLRVTTSQPLSFLPMMMMMVPVFPKENYLAVGATGIGLAPVGTGPFELEAWNEGREIVLARNEAFYRGTPTLGGVRLSWSAEASSRAALLVSGAADIVADLPPQLTEMVEAAPDANVLRVPELTKMMLQMNRRAAPFDDLRVRKAVAHAIDTELLVEAIFGTDGAISDPNLFHPMFPSAGGHDDYVTHDVSATRAILEEVGDLPPIDFHYTVGRYMLDNEVGEAIAGMLEATGFTVNRDPMEEGAFLDLLLTDDMSGLHLISTIPTFAHEDGPIRSYWTTKSVVTYCADPRVDRLVEEAASAEGDEQDRVYNQIERLLIIEEVCPIPLYIQIRSFGVASRVQGFVPRGDQMWDLHTVSLKSEF